MEVNEEFGPSVLTILAYTLSRHVDLTSAVPDPSAMVLAIPPKVAWVGNLPIVGWCSRTAPVSKPRPQGERK